MWADTLLQRLPFLQKVNSVLVCEVDHLSMRAAIIERKGDDLYIAHETHSTVLDFHEAVSEVVSEFVQKGWRGKHAILLSPAVLLAMVQLPIPPKNKLGYEQIAEAIRWEVEPLFAEHDTLLFGRISISHGYLTETQVEDVLIEQDYAKNNISRNPEDSASHKRFGEIALEMGCINQEQLHECLERQAWFNSIGEEIKCGWAVQSPHIEGKNFPANKNYPWLATAVNASLLREWQGAFATHGIQLDYLYPLAGCGTSTLDLEHKPNKKVLVLETHDLLVSGMRMAGDYISSLNVIQNVPASTLMNCSKAYNAVGASESDTIWLIDSKTADKTQALSSGLNSMLQQPIKVLQRPSQVSTVGMLGAARHIMKMKGAQSVSGVPVVDPQAPLMRRFEVRVAAAVLAVLLLMVVGQGLLGLGAMWLNAKNARLSEQLVTVDAEIAKVNSRIAVIKKLKDQIEAKNTEKAKIKNTLNLLTVALPRRNTIVNSMFTEISKSVSDDVVIDQIEEKTLSNFSVNAWSLNEMAAQEFVKNFQSAVQPYQLKVEDVKVGSTPGRLGLQGYSIKFIVTGLVDDALEKAISAQVASNTNDIIKLAEKGL